jgi:ABC-type uncharacterized transport system permease subunit
MIRDVIVISTIIVVFINLFVINVIYQIKKNTKKQTEESIKQTYLLAEIAEKQGVLKSVISEIKFTKFE